MRNIIRENRASVCLLLLSGLLGLWVASGFSGSSADKPSPSKVTWKTYATSDDYATDTRLAQFADTNLGIPTPPLSENSTPAAAEPMVSLLPHPSNSLIAGSRLVRERWSDPDTVGNRERVAIYQTEIFKYSLLRVIETWSGKTGIMDSRLVMVADHLLVRPLPSVDPADFEKQIRIQGFKLRDTMGENGMLLSFGARIDQLDELPLRIAALEGFVEYAEPDYLVWPGLEPNDPDYIGNKLWGLLNRGGVSGYKAGADIDATAAWDIRTDASSVVVSVTDTGIRYTHQDLAPNMWRNPGEIPGDGIDNDGNGVVDDVFGYNAVENNGNPDDDQGHGTHCAGTIGARGDNNIGMTGVAWNVQLMAGRFLGPNGGTTSDGIKVIDYSRLNGAHIISASWGGGGYSQALRNSIAACAAADIPFVAAAGNSGTNNDSRPHYPSSYDLPNIVAVAASNANDVLTGFSCYGRNSVDIAAPGWQIWSSYRGGDSDYRFLQGTSMAAPHVSGALALALAHFPGEGMDRLIGRLYGSSDKLPSLNGKVSTGARLNLHRLIASVVNKPDNDMFDQPFAFEGDFVTWNGHNRDATRESDEDRYSLPAEKRTLWFAWQAPYDGFATLTANSAFVGQRVVVYAGESRKTLSVVNDSGGQNQEVKQTVCRFLAKSGQHYRFVTASDSQYGEPFTLKLELVSGNDLFSQAFRLTGESFETAGSNRGATAQPFEIAAPHAGVGAGHSVWYRWTAPFSGTISFNTEGSEIDSVLAVYTGDPLDPAGFTTIGASDDVNALLRWSRVDFDTVMGVTYHIAVDTAMGGLPGTFVLRGARPAPPVISSEPADLEIPLGGRAVFSVGAAGTPPLQYQWFKGGEALPGAWESTLVLDPLTIGSFDDYRVEVSNSFSGVTSRTAKLSEKLIAPAIVWKSPDLAAATGSSVELIVEASGSLPLTYEWRLSGVPIGGSDTPKLSLSNSANASAGTYECWVTNPAGTATATIRVTAVTSPFDSWQWRLDEMPGPAITEMKVIDGKLYALATDRILVSMNGLEWNTWKLPAGFEGVSLSKLGTTWLCVGMDFSGNGRAVTSTNGITWSVPQILTGLPSGPPLQHVSRIEVFNGRFIGQRASRTSNFGDIYTSTNGKAWTAATLDGTASTVVASGPLALGSGMIITGASSGFTPYAPARAYRSQDGMNWTAFSLPSTDEVYAGSRGASRWNNKFVLFSSSTAKGWTSDDGINWTLQSGKTWSGGVDFKGDFVSLGGAQFDGVSVTWGASPWTAAQTFIKPATGDVISAYAVFNNRVFYGTQRGFIGSLTKPSDLKPFGGSVTVPNQIVFQDNRFFVLDSGIFGNGTRSLRPMVSGDGSNWRKMRPWMWDNRTNPVSAFSLKGFGGGFFWGEQASGAAGPASGFLPHVMPEASVANGLPPSLTSLDTDGQTILSIASDKLHRSTNGGQSWLEITGVPVIANTSNPLASVSRFDKRWLLTNASPAFSGQTGFVHYSDNGTTWTKAAGNAKAGFITKFNNDLYGLENLSNGNVTGWKSTNNGATWVAVPLHATNNLANLTVFQLGIFNNSLVVLVRDSNNVRSVWFSNDGLSWFPGNTPPGIQGFATGLGQFVAYTSNGAIVQAGAPPAGGSAPVVRTDYPLHDSSVITGSVVDVTGKVFDPEGAAITLECHVDGRLIGTSGAGDFRFRFRAQNPTGHTVVLRATDPSGLVGSDELRISAVPPQTENLVDPAEGRVYLPRVAMVELSGAFYAAGDVGILRSTDGLNWKPVLLPALSSKLKGLAAGNGSLVAQTEWGILYSSRDGVNWSQVGPAIYAGYWITQPIIFSGGRFLIIQQVAGQQAINYQTSFNGIDWTSAGVYTSGNRAVSGDNGIIVSVHENVWTGDKAVWSADGGNNWTAIPGIERASWQTFSLAMTYGGGVFLIAASDGRVWRSTDGKSWVATENLPAATAPGVTVRYANGRFFVGSTVDLLFSSSSTIGSAWQTLAPKVKSDSVIHALGRFIARGESGMAWSEDGVTWTNATSGPTTTIGSRLAANGERALVIDSNGAAWSSADALVWRQDFTGISGSAITAQQVGKQMASLGSAIILVGTDGMLLASADNGASWTAATADGQAIPANWNFNQVQVSNGVALATAVIGNTAERLMLRSVNGTEWQRASALDALRIADVASNGTGTWLAVGTAAILSSTDGGLTWEQVNGPTMFSARAVVWFNNQWLLFGATTNSAPSRCWTSPDGTTWTDRGANGMAYSGNDFFRTEGHGRLVVWNRTDQPVITSDGLTWQPVTGYQTWVNNSLYWVTPRSTGFLLATPFISAQAPVQMFSGTPDAQSWVEIPRLQTDTIWATTFNDRLFLFAPGRVVEWTGTDLELELASPPAVTLGVGDVVQSPAVIRNLGGVELGGRMDIDGWLSSDGFFGDGNDVYLGRIQVDVPLTASGEESTVNLSYELPGNVRPGDSRLIVLLDPEDRFQDKNRANNMSISSGVAAIIPQHRLELLVIGNGSVSADQNAEYYPHGARVAMVANTGKGARFSGWGGDAVGSLGATLVVMNSDKTVAANFVATAALTVFTRGGGSVRQPSDDGIYAADSMAELTAVPLPGWTFNGWSGALTGNEPVKSLEMNSGKVVTARFSMGFAAWRNHVFSEADQADDTVSGPQADADGDGVENWREWLRGSHPKIRADHGQSGMRREGNRIVMTYTRMENMPAGYSVRSGASFDLEDWSVPVDERVVGSIDGVETIEASIDTFERPSAFIRIVDSRQDN